MKFATISPHFFENGHPAGIYVCARCGGAHFEAGKKFNAGCGFPSFWQHLHGGVQQKELHTYGRSRAQLLCSRCGAHLGHLFQNRHTPSGLRYCINAASITLQQQPDLIQNNTGNMPLNNEHFRALQDFIKEHRSNESNFNALLQKLDAAIAAAQQEEGATAYAQSLQELKEKQAAEYRTAREGGGTAWPEFEKFVSEWEKTILAAKPGD